MDAYDVKVTSQDLRPKIEHVQLQTEEASFEEKIAIALEKFHGVVGDEYYESFLKKSSQMDVQTAQVFGGRLGKCGAKLVVAMQESLPVDSKEVQELLANHWEVIKMAYPETSSKRIYLAIRDQMCYPPFTQSIPEVAPFCDYLSGAMEIFAQNHFAED